jgi:hypothetical protein
MGVRWYEIVCGFFVGKDSGFVDIYSNEKYREVNDGV